MFQLLSTITLKFGICLYNVKKYAQQYIKNINNNFFNNFLITESRCTRTHLFQKLPSLAPASSPEFRNAPVLHSKRANKKTAYISHCYNLYTEALLINFQCERPPLLFPYCQNSDLSSIVTFFSSYQRSFVVFFFFLVISMPCNDRIIIMYDRTDLL